MLNKDFFRDTVSNIVASSIVALVSVIAGWFFWDQLQVFGNILATPITIPAYFPFLSFVSGLLAFYGGKKFWDWYSMDYTDHRKDTFDGVEWTWDYKGNGSAELDKETLKPICPECQSIMNMSDNEYELRHYEHIQPNIDYPLTKVECPVHSCAYQKLKREYFVDEYLREIYSKVDRYLRKNFKGYD